MESGEENLKNNKVFESSATRRQVVYAADCNFACCRTFSGIEGTFYNMKTLLKAYGLYGIMGPGTIIHGILTVMSAAGKYRF